MLPGAALRETGPDLPTLTREALRAAEGVLQDATRAVRAKNKDPQGKFDAASAWTALAQTRADLRASAIGADGLALSEVIQPHPVLGPINLYQWLLFVGSHEARHTDQVREIAAELSAGSNTTASAI